jgi:hypothetical protein
MSENSKSTASRRDFLKLAATSAPAAVVVVLATGGTAQAEAAPVDLTSNTMQDTAHTRAYLESTRF